MIQTNARVCVLELGANSPNYIFLVKCGKTTIEAFWAINAPHNNEEKEEEKKANGVLVLCIQKEGKYARRNERERNIREESASQRRRTIIELGVTVT